MLLVVVAGSCVGEVAAVGVVRCLLFVACCVYWLWFLLVVGGVRCCRQLWFVACRLVFDVMFGCCLWSVCLCVCCSLLRSLLMVVACC